MKYLVVKTVFFIAVIMSSGFLYAQDANTYYKEGLSLKEQKKSREAMEQFKKALALQPVFPAAVYELGWCQNDLKDYTGAIVSLRKARNGWSDIPKVYFELGYAFEKTIQYDSARVSYEKCIELNPGHSGAYRQLGYIAYEKNDNPAALAFFREYEQRAKTVPVDYLYWFRKGYCNNAVKQYDSARVALLKSLEYKKNYINTYLELGFAATKQLKADEAIGYFNTAIQLEPKNHIPYNGIGEVYRDVKKDIEQAMNWYRKTLELNENERKGNFGMGYCLNAKGLYAEAITYLRRAIASEATYAAAYVELGYSLYKIKNYTEAGFNLRKAIEISPKNENAHYYLVIMYVEQKPRRYAKKFPLKMSFRM